MAKDKKKARKKTSKKVQPRKKTKAKARPKHKFTVSHHREADFDQGLRSYAKYRDLGINKATNGMVEFAGKCLEGSCFAAPTPA
jgi:hypothetical protein